MPHGKLERQRSKSVSAIDQVEKQNKVKNKNCLFLLHN